MFLTKDNFLIAPSQKSGGNLILVTKHKTKDNLFKQKSTPHNKDRLSLILTNNLSEKQDFLSLKQ